MRMRTRSPTPRRQHRRCVRPSAEEEYLNLTLWKEQNLAHFHFILLTRLPVPPQWCVDALFVIKVASAVDDDCAHFH